MRVVVDHDSCDSTGLCAEIAPELFALDDDDRLRILQEHPDPAQWPVAEEAARSCPKLAITVQDGP
jgi:ferredoxin